MGNIKVIIEGDASALTDALQRVTAAHSTHTEVMQALKASIDAQLALATQASALTSQEAVRAMADLMSAQLGARVSRRRPDEPGTGSLARL